MRSKNKQYKAWIITFALDLTYVLVTDQPHKQMLKHYGITRDAVKTYEYLDGHRPMFSRPQPYSNRSLDISTGEYKTKKSAQKALSVVLDMLVKKKKAEHTKDIQVLNKKRRDLKRKLAK